MYKKIFSGLQQATTDKGSLWDLWAEHLHLSQCFDVPGLQGPPLESQPGDGH